MPVMQEAKVPAPEVEIFQINDVVAYPTIEKHRIRWNKTNNIKIAITIPGSNDHDYYKDEDQPEEEQENSKLRQ